MNRLNETAERLGKRAADTSRHLSSQFVEYTEKNPPRAALAALAAGAVVGWIVGFLMRD